MKKKRVYIAGPMTGIEGHNYPAFFDAAKDIEARGWEAINPAENFGGRTDLPRGSYMRADFEELCRCDAIYMLPGWRKSRGARAEYLVARECGLEVKGDADGGWLFPPVSVSLYQHDSIREPESILDEAKRITGGDRQNDYGHPRDDFERTAAIWNVVLADNLADGKKIEASDIPICMIGVKVARHVHTSKRDNLVDIAGYARTAAMVEGYEE